MTTTAWDTFKKPGEVVGGWPFNDPLITFNQAIDVETGDAVFFNGLGTAQVWFNTNKTTTSWTTGGSKGSTAWTNSTK